MAKVSGETGGWFSIFQEQPVTWVAPRGIGGEARPLLLFHFLSPWMRDICIALKSRRRCELKPHSCANVYMLSRVLSAVNVLVYDCLVCVENHSQEAPRANSLVRFGCGLVVQKLYSKPNQWMEFERHPLVGKGLLLFTRAQFCPCATWWRHHGVLKLSMLLNLHF